MGITISFSMRPRKNWIAGQGWSAEKLKKFAAQLAGELGYQYEAAGEYAIYQFCPEGFLWMGYKAGRILGMPDQHCGTWFPRGGDPFP